MKVICISDTHGRHAQLALPDADVVVHAGDISNRGKLPEIKAFLEWFSALPMPNKIFIAGNHDFYFEDINDEEFRRILPENIIYLNDSACVIDGVKFWGSPITPYFHNWAFNRHRGAAIRAHWDLIAEDTDVLITHGPAKGILDKTASGQHVGCADLLHRVQQLKLKAHICGHIHEAYGMEIHGGVKFVNAAVLNENYLLTHEPILLHL